MYIDGWGAKNIVFMGMLVRKYRNVCEHWSSCEHGVGDMTVRIGGGVLRSVFPKL